MRDDNAIRFSWKTCGIMRVSGGNGAACSRRAGKEKPLIIGCGDLERLKYLIQHVAACWFNFNLEAVSTL